MRPLIVSALAFAVMAAVLAAAAPAEAQEYPWCVQYGGSRSGGSNCGFVTWDQCMATRFGNGGFCYRNPFYPGNGYAQEPNPRERPHRKHRDRY